MNAATVSIVIPTIGRDSLTDLLHALRGHGHLDLSPLEIILVDDRPGANGPLPSLPIPGGLSPPVRVIPGRAAGPAAARNVGWRAARGEWIAFLDDDVLPEPDWLVWLAKDLTVEPDVAGSQGMIKVPLPTHRSPTDWERSTAGLSGARWITADMAYRRAVLEEVGGLDERFPRAYREDSDLAIRVRRAGYRLVQGDRHVVHPIRPEGLWVSLKRQQGNADDALMRTLHGPDWRSLVSAPRGRRTQHGLITAAGAATLALAACRSRLAAPAGLSWAVGVAEFAWRRIAPGPKSPEEVATMLVTSALIPPVATYHWLRGWLIHRNAEPWSGPAAMPADPTGAAGNPGPQP